MERMERHITITNALALFVRFWLTTTPFLPNTARAVAQIKGKERYEGYIEALVRRLPYHPTCRNVSGTGVSNSDGAIGTYRKRPAPSAIGLPCRSRIPRRALTA
jgi:hypothetical protein